MKNVIQNNLYDISPITLYKGAGSRNSQLNFSWQSFLIKGWKIIDPYVNCSSVLVFLQVSSKGFFSLPPWELFF